MYASVILDMALVYMSALLSSCMFQQKLTGMLWPVCLDHLDVCLLKVVDAACAHFPIVLKVAASTLF